MSSPQQVEEETTVTSKYVHSWEDDRSTFDPWDGLPRVQMVLRRVVLGSTVGYQQQQKGGTVQ
jgi:hypothetical protein